jgi:hypothetical protein
MVARRNQGLNFHQMGWQDLRSGIRFWPLIPKAGETGCHIPQPWGTEGASRKSYQDWARDFSHSPPCSQFWE